MQYLWNLLGNLLVGVSASVVGAYVVTGIEESKDGGMATLVDAAPKLIMWAVLMALTLGFMKIGWFAIPKLLALRPRQRFRDLADTLGSEIHVMPIFKKYDDGRRPPARLIKLRGTISRLGIGGPVPNQEGWTPYLKGCRSRIERFEGFGEVPGHV